MKLLKVIIFAQFFIFSVFCFGDDNEKFTGGWCINAQEHKVDDYLFIKKIDNNFLIIRISINDEAVGKGIGKIIDVNKMKFEINGNIYFLNWFNDKDGEWLEEYVKPNGEDNSVYERIENFSIDKF